LERPAILKKDPGRFIFAKRWYIINSRTDTLLNIGKGESKMFNMQTRILLLCSTVILLSGFFLSFTVYQASYSLVTQSVGEQARKIVSHAAKNIKLEEYKKISPDQGETAYYKELRAKFNEIRESNGMTYLYTMGRKPAGDGYEYFYVVDGMPFGDENASALGEVEESIDEYPDIVKTFETGEPQVGEFTTDEEYGTLISAFVPLRTASGEVIGIIGGDFNAENVNAQIQQNQRNIVLWIAAILLVSLLVLYFFARILVSPLKELTKRVEIVKARGFYRFV